jgi:hypothetical protein
LFDLAGVKAGLIGALFGFVLGYLDYKIVIGVIGRRLRQVEEAEQAEDLDRFEAHLGRMRIVVLVMTVGVFPVIGFLAGVFLLTPQ